MSRFACVLATVIVSACAISSVSLAWTRVSSETGDHCVDQVRGHLRYLFGSGTEFGSAQKIMDSGISGVGTVWIKSNLCAGYFVGEFLKTASCRDAHYGHVPVYVRRIRAHGDCQTLLTVDSHPTRETTMPYIQARRSR